MVAIKLIWEIIEVVNAEKILHVIKQKHLFIVIS